MKRLLIGLIASITFDVCSQLHAGNDSEVFLECKTTALSTWPAEEMTHNHSLILPPLAGGIMLLPSFSVAIDLLTNKLLINGADQMEVRVFDNAFEFFRPKNLSSVERTSGVVDRRNGFFTRVDELLNDDKLLKTTTTIAICSDTRNKRLF